MVSDKIKAFHDNALVIDSHNDSIVALIRRGNIGLDGSQRSDYRQREGAVAYLRQYIQPLGAGIQLDIPKMRPCETCHLPTSGGR